MPDSTLEQVMQAYILGTPLAPWMLAIARGAFLDERRVKKSRFQVTSRAWLRLNARRVQGSARDEDIAETPDPSNRL